MCGRISTKKRKHTGMKKKKRRKKCKKKQENRTQGVDSNKAPRLCYKAETGILSHGLSTSYSRRQRYQLQVAVLPLSSPPSANESTKTKPNH